MKDTTTTIKKQEVLTMLKAKKTDGKDHLVQASEVKFNDTGGKSKTSLKTSDGYASVITLIGNTADVKNFDLINVQAFKTVDCKGHPVLLIEKYERVFTNISGLIGTPVDVANYKPNEEAKDFGIPIGATCLKPGLRQQQSPPSINTKKEEQKQVKVIFTFLSE
jgi:hypothetical protein